MRAPTAFEILPLDDDNNVVALMSAHGTYLALYIPSTSPTSSPDPAAPSCSEVDARDASGSSCGSRVSYLVNQGRSLTRARNQVATEYPTICDYSGCNDDLGYDERALIASSSITALARWKLIALTASPPAPPTPPLSPPRINAYFAFPAVRIMSAKHDLYLGCSSGSSEAISMPSSSVSGGFPTDNGEQFEVSGTSDNKITLKNILRGSYIGVDWSSNVLCSASAADSWEVNRRATPLFGDQSSSDTSPEPPTPLLTSLSYLNSSRLVGVRGRRTAGQRTRNSH